MKIIYKTMLMTVVVLSFFSCGNDDEPGIDTPPSNPELIVLQMLPLILIKPLADGIDNKCDQNAKSNMGQTKTFKIGRASCRERV